MTRTAPPRGPETTAVLGLLDTAGILTGDAQRPPGGGFPSDDPSQQFVPYAVLYAGVPTSIDGPSDDPNADTTVEYQITSVGVTRAQADFTADKARTAMLQNVLVVPGRFVQLVEWTQSRPAERDDDVIPPLFYAVDLYAISTTPA